MAQRKTSCKLEVKRLPDTGCRRCKPGADPGSESVMSRSSSRIDKQIPLSVGDVAARSGVAVSTLHFYEQQGLIQSWRSSGNQRRYHRDVLRRIAVIKVAQRLGLPLAAIAEALATLPTGRTVTAADWKRL